MRGLPLPGCPNPTRRGRTRRSTQKKNWGASYRNEVATASTQKKKKGRKREEVKEWVLRGEKGQEEEGRGRGFQDPYMDAEVRGSFLLVPCPCDCPWWTGRREGGREGGREANRGREMMTSKVSLTDDD